MSGGASNVANPIGLDGIDFVEFSTSEPKTMTKLFEQFGFRHVANHKSKKIELYRQGDVNFLLNTETKCFAADFRKAHGPSICSMGFRVKDQNAAIREATARGARQFENQTATTFAVPTMYGIGDSLVYFVDTYGSKGSLFESEFDWLSNDHQHKGFGYTMVDHLTNNVPAGKMQEWCDFYTKIFGFTERRYFDIRGKKTGLISKVMASADGKICIPINEPTDKKSQIQEYLDEYKGPGIQHLALLTSDICPSVARVREQGVQFLDVPDTYYEMLHERVPNVTEKTDRLRELKILVDGDKGGYLLQIFTKNIVGPIFFEVIQRKGHDGFGDGNFQALFDAIERDQMQRGVV